MQGGQPVGQKVQEPRQESTHERRVVVVVVEVAEVDVVDAAVAGALAAPRLDARAVLGCRRRRARSVSAREEARGGHNQNRAGLTVLDRDVVDEDVLDDVLHAAVLACEVIV